MSLRRFTILCVCWFCGLLLAPAVWGAGTSGTIESVSADGKKLIVKPTGDKPKKVFAIPDGVKITLDGKAAKPSDLKDGQQITVFTNSSETVTQIIARTEKEKSTAPAAAPTSKSPSKGKEPKSSPMGTKSSVASESTSNDNGDAKTGDSSQFRGPRRDGHAGTGNNIANSWPKSGPKPLWPANGLGSGYAAVSVANGRIYTMGSVGNDEKVFALNERDGKAGWAVSTGGGAFREGQGDGPRCTPTVDGDRVYALGALGDLVCLDAKSGQRRWHKNILKEFDGRNIQWGICESPLIDGDKVIVTPGGRGATLVALNKNNGNVIWKSRVSGDPNAGYASAIAIEVGGVRQYVNFTARGLIGVRANDGEFLWQNGSAANGTANCSAPVFHDNHIFYGSGYGTGGACVRLESNGNTSHVEEIYKTKQMKNHHGGMVVVDGFLYGCDEERLTCLDLLSGKVIWQDRAPGKGSITFADGMLIVRGERGPVTLVEANSQQYVEKGQFEQPNRSGRNAWAYPVVANGHLYLRDQETLLCYDLRK